MFLFIKNKTTQWLVCAIVLLITLFFGFKPKGFRFYNQVQCLQDQNSLSFQNIGMVYSKKTLGDIGISNNIYLVMKLKPYRTGRRLSKILSIIDSDGDERMTLEQWKKGLMVSLWDTKRKRMGRIGIDDALCEESMRLIAVTISNSEMKIFSEQSSGLWKNKPIQLPSNFFKDGRLILGMASNGRNPWQGEMGGLAIFKNEPSKQEIIECARVWNKLDSIQKLEGNLPAAFFLFDSDPGIKIDDRSGNGWDLVVPFYPKIFKREVLSILSDSKRIDSSLMNDILINWLGFIPLGACFYGIILSLYWTGSRTILIAVACAVFVSFGIELLQAFIPTRSSQFIDVVFNGLGAWTGAILVHIARAAKDRAMMGVRI
jgi:glycopeptide antibiotics resistance protein